MLCLPVSSMEKKSLQNPLLLLYLYITGVCQQPRKTFVLLHFALEYPLQCMLGRQLINGAYKIDLAKAKM